MKEGVDVPIWVGMFWTDSSSEYDVGLKQRIWSICVKFKKTSYSEVKFDCCKKNQIGGIAGWTGVWVDRKGARRMK